MVEVKCRLERDRNMYVWVIIVCPFCGKKADHWHAGGPLDDDPRKELFSRVSHCFNSEWRPNELYLLVDGDKAATTLFVKEVQTWLKRKQDRRKPTRDGEKLDTAIDANQLARRNLTADAYRLALGRRYNRTKKAHGGDRKSKAQSEPLNTAEAIAEEHGVSRETVKRAGKFAEEVDADPELQQAVRPILARNL